MLRETPQPSFRQQEGKNLQESRTNCCLDEQDMGIEQYLELNEAIDFEDIDRQRWPFLWSLSFYVYICYMS